jgi:hypothetical protein
MSQEPSTPGSNQPLSNAEIQAASAIAPPPTPYTDDQIALFLEAYDCTKNNRNWNTVTSAISNHPEWLTRIPQGLFYLEEENKDLYIFNQLKVVVGQCYIK